MSHSKKTIRSVFICSNTFLQLYMSCSAFHLESLHHRVSQSFMFQHIHAECTLMMHVLQKGISGDLDIYSSELDITVWV